MEQGQSNTKIAGIDVGKRSLDAAVHGRDEARPSPPSDAIHNSRPSPSR